MLAKFFLKIFWVFCIYLIADSIWGERKWKERQGVLQWNRDPRLELNQERFSYVVRANHSAIFNTPHLLTPAKDHYLFCA